MRRLSGYGPSLIVLSTALLVLFIGPSAVQTLTYKQIQARMVKASLRLETNDILEQLNRAYQDISTFVEPSVVHISAQQAGRDSNGFVSLSSGSGWVYDDEGHIVTNHHVVRDAERIEVQFSSGDLREAEIVGADRTTDIALIKVRPGHLHPATRADVMGNPVLQGDMVFAFGSPFDFRFSMSSGVVSGKGRYVGVIGRTGYENFIQVDAAINPGNSGGPLTDYRGRVIGMNTAIATGRRATGLDEGQFAGIGLAIPLEMIEPVVDQIIDKGFVEKGYLGVRVIDIDPGFRTQTGFVGEGVRILSVERDGPAEVAGVRRDDIVTEVNGQAVAGRTQLRSVISSILPGEAVELRLWRLGSDNASSETLTVSVRLARLDPLLSRGELPDNQSRDRIIPIGISKMSTSTPELARSFGAEHRPGVLIESTVARSPIAMSVSPGAIIIEVEGRPVTNVDELIEELRKENLMGDVFLGGSYLSVIRPDGTHARVRVWVGP